MTVLYEGEENEQKLWVHCPYCLLSPCDLKLKLATFNTCRFALNVIFVGTLSVCVIHPCHYFYFQFNMLFAYTLQIQERLGVLVFMKIHLQLRNLMKVFSHFIMVVFEFAVSSQLVFSCSLQIYVLVKSQIQQHRQMNEQTDRQ